MTHDHIYNSIFKQNILEKYFIFTIYQNYTLALNVIYSPRSVDIKYLKPCSIGGIVDLKEFLLIF